MFKFGIPIETGTIVANKTEDDLVLDIDVKFHDGISEIKIDLDSI